MSETTSLSNFASISNGVFSSVAANSSSITSITIGDAVLNASSFSGTANIANYLSNTSGTLSNIIAWVAANAATTYSNATLYSSNADNLTSGTIAEPRLPFRMDQSIRTTDAVQFSSLTVTGNVVVNGNFTVVSGNTVAFTDNMLFINQGVQADISNISGNGTVITFTANNNYQTGWDVLVANVNPSSYNGTYHNITFANSTIFRVSNTNSDAYVSGGTARGQTESNPDLGIAAGYNDGTYHHTGIFRDHSSGIWKVFDSYLPEPDTSIYIDQANASFRIANFQANTIYIGQNDSYATINSISYSGNANTATYANEAFTNTFTVGTAAYFVANGNLGLGTISPNAKLVVNGEIITSNLIVTNSVNASSVSVNNNFYSQTTTNKTLAVTISVGNVLTLDLAQSNFFTVALDKNINTITVNNTPNNVVAFYIISFDIDGSYTIAWPGSFKWKDGTPPTISSNTSDTQTFIFYTADGGTTTQAFNAGNNR